MEALKGPHHDFICRTDRRMSQHRMGSRLHVSGLVRPRSRIGLPVPWHTIEFETLTSSSICFFASWNDFRSSVTVLVATSATFGIFPTRAVRDGDGSSQGEEKGFVLFGAKTKSSSPSPRQGSIDQLPHICPVYHIRSGRNNIVRAPKVLPFDKIEGLMDSI